MNQKQVTMVAATLMLGNFMSGLDGTIINTAIPSIVASLHGIQFMGWIIAIFLLGVSISIPIWTKIGEKITNKGAFQFSLVLFVIGSALQGLAPNMLFFLIARLIMGLGAGGMGSLPYIISGYIFKNLHTRTKVVGYLTASYNGAAILGPLVGGWLIDTFSWHWVFYVNIPIGIIAFILCMIYYKPMKPRITPSFDTLGAMLLTTSLLIFLVGLQLQGISSTIVVISLIILGIIFGIIFFLHEKKAANPIIPISLFKNRNLNGDFLLFSLTWGAYIAVNTYLPMWAQALLGLSALIGGNDFNS